MAEIHSQWTGTWAIKSKIPLLKPKRKYTSHIIIHLYKQNGNPQGFDNHRGTSLLSKAEKILTTYLLNVHLHKAGLVPESQYGFRKDRGAINMIYTTRQLQEKCQQLNIDLFIALDPTKAFNTVSCNRLWKIMATLGCPPRFHWETNNHYHFISCHTLHLYKYCSVRDIHLECSAIRTCF